MFKSDTGDEWEIWTGFFVGRMAWGECCSQAIEIILGSLTENTQMADEVWLC